MPDASKVGSLHQKLLAARTHLILDRPFLGALAMRLPLNAVQAPWCTRTHTDGRAIYYNPVYVDALNFEQTQFTLSAQALHCALLHFARRGTREQERWDRACAFAVNQILFEEGLQPPYDAWLDKKYLGMTAEEIYPLLESAPAPHEASAEDGTEDQGTEPDSGNPSQPETLAGAALEALEQQWQQRMAGAAQQARHSDRLGPGLARLVDLSLQPVLPWRAVLARYLNARARDDYSYARPSNRRGSPAIFPSRRSAQLDLVVAVDVSGSIDADEFGEFVTEVDSLKSQVRARVTLLACDSKLTDASPWIFEAWDTCELPPTIAGGGATDFRPVFDWVDDQDQAPDLVVYFTDAAGSFPESPPQYPTLWLVKGPRAVPFGERIQLN